MSLNEAEVFHIILQTVGHNNYNVTSTFNIIFKNHYLQNMLKILYVQSNQNIRFLLQSSITI